MEPKKKTKTAPKAAAKSAPSAKKTVAKKPAAKKPAAKKPAAKSTSKKVTAEQIAERAHLIYLERMNKNIPGDEESDWLQAEAELRTKK